MATNRYGISSLRDYKRQPVLDRPIYDESFSFRSTQVDEFLNDQNPDTLKSLVLKYFVPIAEIEANVTSEHKNLMQNVQDLFKGSSSYVSSKLSSILGISPETDDVREYLIHSGSSREELFLPPYKLRSSDGSDTTPYESADLDLMYLIRQPLLCEFPSKAITDNAHLVMDNSGCHLGFTKIHVQGNADALPEQLKKSILQYEGANYLSSETVLSSIQCDTYTGYKSKAVEHGVEKGQLTRQGPAINLKVLNEDDDSLRMFFDMDFVPTLKCDGLPKQLWSFQERIRDAAWPPEEVRLQMFQKPCYAVGVGYHGSPRKDLEWRLSTSALESVLGSSLTPVQRKCYMLFKILHKIALKEPKLLATYHLKNILFEILEETEGSASIWAETNMMHCLNLLLDKLISHLEKGKVMSYFIEGYNLIDHYPPETIQVILEIVKAVRKTPERYLMMFDRKFAFDFYKHKIFQDDFQPYFELVEKESPEKDFQLIAHSIVLSLIRHVHSDISTNDSNLYHRAYALLEDAWKIMEVINPEFNSNKFSFMSDVTYAGLEVDESCKFQEYLRIKCPETLALDEQATAFANMLGIELPALEQANPLFKLLTYRMFTLECFCESKELDASGIQVTNFDVYSGTEPDIIAISGTMQRAMLKVFLWISKMFSPPVVTTPEELQLRKAALSMEVMKEMIPEASGESNAAGLADFVTGMTNIFSNVQLSDSTLDHAKELEETVNAVSKPKDKNTSTAKLTVYELFIQYLNGSLDINLYLLSAYNTIFLFLMFGMKKPACRMLIRLNPTFLWNFSLLNSSFFEIDLKNLNRYVTKLIFPEYLYAYIDTASSPCKVKVDFFHHFLLIECSTSYPGFFDAGEIEQALTSASKKVQDMNAGATKHHCSFLLSTMYFRLNKFVEAQNCLESIAISDVSEETRGIVEEALQLYQCLVMSMDI